MQDASTRAATLQRAAELSTAESCIEKHGKIRLLFIMRDFGDIEVARAWIGEQARSADGFHP